ncbi:MAG: PaaX family transcriptional regulator, phenylacetic acid degradation operon negative regulatory protein [candidate division Kazan bacterium GW2011_GWA1_50_15]|uniref:PaaX domain protein n=2 Tax=Bacteria division Kazan-3B-28 TaxID=1798534 RepID=A0A0G1X7L8_UNCK3|nr:MAG: PaaX family transcriptional regulator, phenylacetic acid degradation operon negative regulatory protein [candidate division Kazan bacterium GW2011_GWA1_50_15]KKW25519.1 MAG: PaaX domain protein [candidate division Kazan bacterium GW2011_GWC1_52_13]KKW26825.1 MAG: PaaX domain protein [candidate division Kazan bacterium GW2011_GWB1_52_7]
MKYFMRLSDEIGELVLDELRQRKLRKSPRAGEGRSFRYLKQAGYLVPLGENRFQITDLARINFLAELVKGRKPDGQWRIVIFDIPEKLKRSRNVFRRHLRELGFRMKQQSVWVSPLPCDDLVELVIKYHGLGRYAELLVGTTVALH